MKLFTEPGFVWPYDKPIIIYNGIDRDDNSVIPEYLNKKPLTKSECYMTQEEITAGKILLLEFLGYEYKGNGIYMRNGGSLGENYVDFNESWDDLMPVVEKIEKIPGITINIEYEICTILNDKHPQSKGGYFKDSFGSTKIEATYTAVVEFCKWYKENGAKDR